jgi:hypothetical protein
LSSPECSPRDEHENIYEASRQATPNDEGSGWIKRYFENLYKEKRFYENNLDVVCHRSTVNRREHSLVARQNVER